MKIVINRQDNPEFLNSFLDYSITILSKSPNSIKEYFDTTIKHFTDLLIGDFED